MVGNFVDTLALKTIENEVFTCIKRPPASHHENYPS